MCKFKFYLFALIQHYLLEFEFQECIHMAIEIKSIISFPSFKITCKLQNFIKLTELKVKKKEY